MNELALFADHGCPFAHRVLALLEHLQLDFELHESSIGYKPSGMQQYSPTGRIPLLVHDDLALTESRVILEYLGDRFGWPKMLSDDINRRARERLAVALVDEYLTPMVWNTPGAASLERLGEAFDLFEGLIIEHVEPTLLTLTIAPIWHQLRWLDNDSPVVRTIAERPALRHWLDATANLACVRATAPDRDRVFRDLQHALREGLIAGAAG